MTAIPYWIQILQALLTPVIATAVGIIGFMQWRTAHQKVVLDLFDRRLAVYSKLRHAVSKIMTSGQVTEQTDRLLLEAEDEATFLFGPEVPSYIRRLFVMCVEYGAQCPREGKAGPQFSEVHRSLMKELGRFYESGGGIFAPYMRMDQKRVPMPAEWVAERNRQRLSYADEKQR
jgi:hypothetical protein